MRRPFSNCLAYESASLTNIDSVISELIYTVQYDDQAVSRFRSLRATSRFDTFSRLTDTFGEGGIIRLLFGTNFINVFEILYATIRMVRHYVTRGCLTVNGPTVLRTFLRFIITVVLPKTKKKNRAIYTYKR